MTLPSVEIIFLDSSKQYQDDPGKSLNDLVEYLKTVKGPTSIRHAPLIEDSTKAYVFAEWDTYEDHKVIMDSPTYDVDVIAKVLPALSSTSPPSLKLVHVQFDKDISKILQAPVTEVFVATLKPESKDKKEDVKGYFAHLAVALDGIAISAAWGQAREDEDFFVAIIGWKSVEAHTEARKLFTEETRNAIASIRELATAAVNHSKLVQYL